MTPSKAAAVFSAHELIVRYGAQTVLDRATISIHEGERVGLVGRNGSGKSTFLKIAAGLALPDAGDTSTRRELVTGYLPQMFALDDAATVHANVEAGAGPLLGWLREYEEGDAGSTRSGELLERIQHFDGWDLGQRAQSLLTNLHAPAPDRLVGTLSGGEKRRVALCRALLARPDFLILDEPTNHLDTESIEWLEDFLARYTGTCLFVTHDRYFLDRISTRIIELARGQFVGYEGSYTDYLITKAQRDAAAELQEHKRQKFLKHELAWVRKGPRARRTKSVDRVERYFEMAAEQAPEEEIDVELIIPPAAKMSNRILELREVAMDLGGRTLFRDLSLDLTAGTRLGIVGRNGLGKSTLLKVMLGEMAPTRGEVEIGARTQVNYVDQNRLLLDDAKTIYDEVGEGLEYVKLGEENISLRGYLRRFLFTEDRINTRIELLSGGERSRVLLAKILKRGGNVLILDEPTNDLDLGTLRLLEEALVSFGGSVIVVSHDRYFLNRVCTAILAFAGEGVVRFNVGNYDYYLEKCGSGGTKTKVEIAAPAAGATPRPAVQKLKWKEERELEGIEATIQVAEVEVATMEANFAQADFYAAHGHEWPALEAQLARAKAEVTRLYARWEELEARRAAAAATS